jgi:hypothetical protein
MSARLTVGRRDILDSNAEETTGIKLAFAFKSAGLAP